MDIKAFCKLQWPAHMLVITASRWLLSWNKGERASDHLYLSSPFSFFNLGFIFISFNNMLLILYELIPSRAFLFLNLGHQRPSCAFLYAEMGNQPKGCIISFLPFAFLIEVGSSHLNELSDWALNASFNSPSKPESTVIKMHWPSLEK